MICDASKHPIYKLTVSCSMPHFYLRHKNFPMQESKKKSEEKKNVKIKTCGYMTVIMVYECKTKVAKKRG